MKTVCCTGKPDRSRGITKYEDLPENCRKYVEFIEEKIGYPITLISNGPGRHEIIYRGFED